VARNIPEVARNIPEVARNIPEVARNIPEVARNIPEVARNIPEMARNIPEVARNIPEFARITPRSPGKGEAGGRPDSRTQGHAFRTQGLDVWTPWLDFRKHVVPRCRFWGSILAGRAVGRK